MSEKKLILLLPLLLFMFNSFAEEKHLEFLQHLTIADNLSHNGVTDIFQDSRGYLWISTYDGLNRYDGYEFKVFKNTIDNKIFSSNRIRAISEDKKGNLWIGTDDGVSIYNYSEEKFTTIYSNRTIGNGDKGPIVRKIITSDKNNVIVCITEESGICLFNKNYLFRTSYLPPPNLSKNPIIFFDGILIDETNYIFTSSIGLLQFDISTKKFSLIYRKELNQNSSILNIEENKFLAVFSGGIGIFDYKKMGDSYSFTLNSIKLPSYDFRKAFVDKIGNLWLGTQNEGIVRVDNLNAIVNDLPFKTKTFKGQTGRLRISCFSSLCESGCWVGSFDEGIFRFNLEDRSFKIHNPNHEYGFIRNINNLSHLSVWDKDRVFMTVGGGGLVLLNTLTEKFEPLPFSISKQELNDISSIFVDSEKSIWLQLGEDYKLFRIRNGQTRKERVKIESLFQKRIGHARSITEDKNGNIWLGTIDNVFKISLNKAREITTVESLKENPFFQNKQISLIRRIYADPLYDFIWIGSDVDGLFRIKLSKEKALKDAEVNQFSHELNNKLSVSGNFVSSIIRLPNSELWIGTEGSGICKVVNSDTKPEFVSFSEKNGLSNNVVKSLLYDEEYNLWISTNIGLNRFNTKDFTFRSFRTEDGLPFEDFFYASAKLDNGWMVFSGINDFCYFNPNDLADDELLPALIFSEFKIHNKTILPGDTINNRVLLYKPITIADEIVLKHNENVFSLQLTSLHYATPENHYLKYQLLPINEEWVEVPSNQRTINYNGLLPGEYELHVMASNSLNEWTEPKILKIIIKPPFWITAPAFILYLLIIGLIIYLIMHYILRMNKLKYKLEIEHLEKENAKEVNAAKLRFFSNISHEIKTPLTLISGPVNLMSERYKGNTDLSEKLKIVQRQSKKIAQLVDQVHDFQRADVNKLKMNYSVFNFNTFISELASDFGFLANTDKKQFELEGIDSEIFVSADKDKLEKIFNNLLNNAFKYTKANDTIKIEYKQKDKDLLISVTDTGKGIDSNDLPHIFERFYQSNKKQEEYIGGSGIGLAFTKRLVEMHYGYIHAESLLHKGTTIFVKLPVISDETTEKQKEQEQKILSVEKGFEPNYQPTDNVNSANIKINGNFSEARIFFAEDNSEMRTFVTGILSNFFRVTAFPNGQECLNTMEKEWPDIIISDVLMPELNGFNLCKRIKSDIKTSHIPVILLTACTTIEEQILGLEVGADSYIKKPFNIQHLVTRTETLLQNRKQLRERFQIDYPLVLEKNDSNTNDISFLEKLYDLMEENLDNTELDMDKFARKLYLNRTHFYQKVKALTNQTPFELLKMYRLKKASELLIQKQVSVNEVYVMTGFKSRSNFSKLFKEKYNSTPGKYATDALKRLE